MTNSVARKTQRSKRTKPIWLDCVLALLCFLFAALLAFCHPERQIGTNAWYARYLSIVVFWPLTLLAITVFLWPRIRRKLFFLNEPLTVVTAALRSIIASVILLIGTAGIWLPWDTTVNLVKDMQQGPITDQISKVRLEEVPRVIGKYGRKVLFKRAVIFTDSGRKIQIDFRTGEWENYGDQLYPGRVFVYYPHSHIWQP